MKRVDLVPSVHLFVCANQRPDDSPLGPGCAGEGEALFAALKDLTLKGGLVSRVWVTRTGCLGVCPKSGAAVACYPDQRIWGEVLRGDAKAILEEVLGR